MHVINIGQLFISGKFYPRLKLNSGGRSYIVVDRVSAHPSNALIFVKGSHEKPILHVIKSTKHSEYMKTNKIILLHVFLIY